MPARPDGADALAARLRLLAPHVDVERARALFEADRSGTSGGRGRRGWLLTAAAVTVVVAGVVAIWAVGRRGDPSNVPADTVDATVVRQGVELVQSFSSIDGPTEPQIVASGDRAAFEDQWATFFASSTMDVSAPEIDFRRSIAVIFSLERCTADLDGFDVAGNVWSPRLGGPPSGDLGESLCDDPFPVMSYVVAIDRRVLRPTAIDDEVVIRTPLDSSSTVSTTITVGGAPAGDEFEVLLVAESQAAFGQIRASDTPAGFEALWSELAPGPSAPAVDFARSVALVVTMPDNACPDTLVRFAVAGERWTPVFQEFASACNDPLLSWVYVVAVDRDVLGDPVTFDLPADEVYGVEASSVSIAVGTPLPTASFEEVPADGWVPTGIRVPTPERGVPAFHLTPVGPVWVVLPDGADEALVLRGVVDAPADEDAGVTGLGSLVLADDDGNGFAGGGVEWDANGRAINAPRAADLTGYAGFWIGDEVEIVLDDAARLPGEVTLPTAPRSYSMPDLGEPIDVATWVSSSSSGPTWRHLDATLVVERGVGRICELPSGAPAADQATCDDADIVLETRITSSDPDITSWFHAPILAFQDPLEGFTTVVPLGGMSGRNDGEIEVALDEIEVLIERIEDDCDPPDPGTVIVSLLPGWRVDVEVAVIAGGEVRGSVDVTLADGGAAEIGVTVDESIPATADQFVRVSSQLDPSVIYAEVPHVGCA